MTKIVAGHESYGEKTYTSKVAATYDFQSLDYHLGVAKTEIFSGLLRNKHEDVDQVRTWRSLFMELHSMPEPNAKSFYCPKSMLSVGYLDNKWFWSPTNSFGGTPDTPVRNARGDGAYIDIEAKAKDFPQKPPCGLWYRPSENYPISSGRQPWLVRIRVGPQGSPLACTGSVVSPRHVVTAANCLCSVDWRYNMFGKGHRRCSVEEGGKNFVHHYSQSVPWAPSQYRYREFSDGLFYRQGRC